MTFPGAATDRDDSRYVIVGAPLDVSATFRPGARFGPERIRSFARSFEDYDEATGLCFTDCAVADTGDIHAWNDVPEYLEFLEGSLRDIRSDGAVPVLFGGEHTVSIAGVRATRPDVFVCFDAHLDLRDRFDGDPYSHACITRRVLETVEEVIVIGARSGAESEWDRARNEDVTVVRPEAVPAWIDDDRLAEYCADRTLYCSVDIDVVDPAFAPGTGTMEPFGLDPRSVRDLLRSVTSNTVGFDVVEVTDRDNGQSATLAGKLARDFVFHHTDSHR